MIDNLIVVVMLPIYIYIYIYAAHLNWWAVLRL